MREFFSEYAYLMLLAFFVFVFIKGFMPLAKVAATKVPVSGFQEAMAA